MKKILAFVLAAATAVSMFATSVSAISYLDEDAYTAGYNAAKVEFTGDGIKVTQKLSNGGADKVTTIVSGVDLSNFIDHIVLGDPYGTPNSYDAYLELNPTTAEYDYGYIYMYDYLKNIDPDDDRKHAAALEDFADLVAEMQRASRDEFTRYTYTDLTSAWTKAYRSGFETGYDNVSTIRWDAINTARRNAAAASKYYKNGSFDANLFDADDVADYNAKALFDDVVALQTLAAFSSIPTSEIIYLNNEYERIVGEIAFADTTAIMDSYFELLDQISDYTEDDYSASAWREVQELVEEAEAEAADAVSIYDWREALDLLEEADSIRGKAVDYTDLQDALLALYSDNNGKSKVSYIEATYSGTAAKYCVYEKADFEVRTGYTLEWEDFAIDRTENGKTYESAYTKAYKLYKAARASATSVKQSQLEKALAELNDAVDALVAKTDDIDEWKLVKLQGLVDEAEALNEADFNTTTKKWDNFQEDLEKAKATLEKANPSESEVERVTTALDKALNGDGSDKGIKANAKKVSTALKDELKSLIREADKLMSNVTTQTGAQFAALKETSEEAYDVFDRINIGTNKTAPISEVEAAIADLTAAIVNFNNPQGWYKEDGKWFYGIGGEVYADGWAQIGETWFMFNEDGSMKASEWFQVDGKWYWANENGGLAIGWAKVNGKWYFFDQGNAMKTGWAKVDNNWYYLASSGAMVTGWNKIDGNFYYFYNNGAMAANTTVGGYKVDANGVWVA